MLRYSYLLYTSLQMYIHSLLDLLVVIHIHCLDIRELLHWNTIVTSAVNVT